ncbi:gas vesicle protein GvpO [Streptomyces sp. NPDC049881]|uniref:gas vesicle protein GvpO n=1 Tax=Streptomyces sp. NPDC049881 TaxID=3155778 RepID=UPI0034175856
MAREATEHSDDPNDDTNDDSPDDTGAGPARAVLEMIGTAGAEFTALTGLRAEAVTRLERHGNGWLLEAEVVETPPLRRTPAVLAVYEVTTGPDGRVTGCRRVRRYRRHGPRGPA